MPRLPRNVVKRGRMFYFRARVNGKAVWRSLSPRLDEARRKAAFLRQELRASSPENPKPETVEGFSKRWFSEYVGQRRNKKNVKLAKQRFSDGVAPVIGHFPLGEVQVAELRAVRAFSEAAGRAPFTVRHVLSDLRCLLRYAVETGDLDRVPSFRQVMPKVQEEAPKRLSEKEVSSILGKLSTKQAFVVRLALETGLRWGEIQRLQWRHVVKKPYPHLVVELTKSGKVRRVPLSKETESLLSKAFKRTSSVSVSPYRMKNPCTLYRNAEERFGFRWHFHQLRHTFACRFLERGGSKEALQKLLGHSTIRLTERYGALSDDAVFREWERVEAGSRRGSRRKRETRKSLEVRAVR